MTGDGSRTTRSWLVAGLITAGSVGAAVGGAVFFAGPDTPTISDADTAASFEHDYLIPLGTQGRLDNGELVEIVPQILTVRVGESIRIVNDDTADHIVGGFFVPAGSTLRQHFTSPGELSGECDVHPSGTFRLIVEP